ncbi:MAG: hypothetical protein ABSD47_15600 [Candidatus Methylomirabilota bacterium]|jgi:hypothetical protein
MTRREFLSRAAVTTGSVVLASAAAPALGAQVAGRGAEPKLGAQLIGKLEGPELVMDPEKWPKKFGEAPMLADPLRVLPTLAMQFSKSFGLPG